MKIAITVTVDGETHQAEELVPEVLQDVVRAVFKRWDPALLSMSGLRNNIMEESYAVVEALKGSLGAEIFNAVLEDAEGSDAFLRELLSRMPDLPEA